ncbi:39S ribosomal protein L1, mitochondrial, partial [Elysia marginata]
TKFLSNIRDSVRLPHEFPYGSPPNILVFSKNEDSLSLATSLGAKQAGTPQDIIKQINEGVLNPKDFEHVLSTSDCATEILPARSHFRDRFPQRAKGSLGPDLQEMWDKFYYGYCYESTKLADAIGRVQVPLGLLEQPVDDLVENFNTYITHICQHRSITLGPFIQSINVVAPPSPEEFIIRVEDYVPGYKTEDVDSDAEDENEAFGQ